MLKLPGRIINISQLGEELKLLDLPGFTGLARLSREVDGQGKVVLENGAVKRVPPYILIKSDDLSEAQIAAARKAVADHVPVADPLPAPRFEDQAKAIESATTLNELKAALAPLTRSL